MSLPHGFLDELRNRLSIAQVVGRKVIWDSRKSNPGKGDYWAPCPFHQEKTASFHVDDKKGYYYCFGCHQKGDAVSFVRETENVGFMEAVEILAREAGVPMPARDPAAQQKSDERAGLAEVMEQAVKFYRLQLKTSAAREARDYLVRRGLSEATLERFQIGFAPEARTMLYDHLTSKGIKPEEVTAAGLCIRPDDGGQPYDRFRGRIMFPIRDPRGRAIAFGGRAMDPNARAKYLNSNETALFDKGRSLYNHGPAREASGKSGALVVAEGYMDVIALVQAGIEHAVAPLGTAITEDQLRLMWRIADEPVIALDGDKAGIRAAMRLIDIALPMLEAGKSLRFCHLPEGLDPDDVIKSQGAKAMSELLTEARPMVDLLWQRETEDRVFDSPERRAAFDASLKSVLALIKDPSIRTHYEVALREKRRDLFASTRKPRTFGGERRFGPKTPAAATQSAKASLLAQRNAGAQTDARVHESLILAACLLHPGVAVEVEADLEKMQFLCQDLAQMRNQFLSILHDPLHINEPVAAAVQQEIAKRLGYDALEKLMQIGQVRANIHVRPAAVPARVRQVIVEEILKQNASIGMLAEIRDAEEELTGVADEGLTWRLQQASEAKQRAMRDPLRDEGNDQNETKGMSEHLQSLIDGQVWLRKQK